MIIIHKNIERSVQERDIFTLQRFLGNERKLLENVKYVYDKTYVLSHLNQLRWIRFRCCWFDIFIVSTKSELKITLHLWSYPVVWQRCKTTQTHYIFETDGLSLSCSCTYAFFFSVLKTVNIPFSKKIKWDSLVLARNSSNLNFSQN